MESSNDVEVDSFDNKIREIEDLYRKALVDDFKINIRASIEADTYEKVLKILRRVY